MQSQTCAICSREESEGKGHWSNIIKNKEILDIIQPVYHHHSKNLWQGALILSDSLKMENGRQVAWICEECLSALWKKKLPRFALANGLWIGERPFKLEMLTIPEQLLIGQHFPRCFAVKLYPCEGGMHLSQDQLHRGIKGNVSLYELNSEFSVLRTRSYYKNLGQKIDGSASICAVVAGRSCNILQYIGGF